MEQERDIESKGKIERVWELGRVWESETGLQIESNIHRGDKKLFRHIDDRRKD